MTNNVQIRQPPSHLICVKGRFQNYFIAMKHDKQYNHVDATGFFISGKSYGEESEKEIRDSFTELVSSTIEHNPEKIIEISFPWAELISVQSLVYRHKGIKQ